MKSFFSSLLTKKIFLCLSAIFCFLELTACSFAPERIKGDTKPHPGVAKARKLPIQGIDVSKWQGDIDWNRVRKAGIHFAYIKATEGGDHIDSKFFQNWYGAKKAGIPRGAYHFVFWCRAAEDQAEWFKKNVPNDPDALPPVLDLEWNHQSRNCPKGVSPEQALEMAKYLLIEMERHTGKRPVIYTDIPFHDQVLKNELHDYPFWIRSVAAEPHLRYDQRRWTFWQYTTTGHVSGIATTVDRNAFFGNADQWKAMLATACDPRDIRRLARLGLCSGK